MGFLLVTAFVNCFKSSSKMMPCIEGKAFMFLSIKTVKLNLCQYFKLLEMKNNE